MSANHDGHGTKAIVAALLANLGIAVAKFVGFLITGSSSLLAEAGHSAADTTNQGLLLLGGRQAKRDADELHPFGYGMTRYFWSFVVALILFSFGALFAIYEGVHKIQHPEELDNAVIAVAILVVAIALEAYSFRTAMAESRPLKGDQSWWSFIRHARVPELPVLLLEDSAALLGLLLALGGVGMTLLTDDPVWDGIGTVAIGLVLLVVAVVLVIEMRSLLLGEAASAGDVRRLQAAVQGSPRVGRLIHMRTMHLGPDELLVGAKIELHPALSVAEVAAAIDETEAAMRAAVPITQRIYLEPAIHDPSRR